MSITSAYTASHPNIRINRRAARSGRSTHLYLTYKAAILDILRQRGNPLTPPHHLSRSPRLEAALMARWKTIRQPGTVAIGERSGVGWRSIPNTTQPTPPVVRDGRFSPSFAPLSYPNVPAMMALRSLYRSALTCRPSTRTGWRPFLWRHCMAQHVWTVAAMLRFGSVSWRRHRTPTADGLPDVGSICLPTDEAAKRQEE